MGAYFGTDFMNKCVCEGSLIVQVVAAISQQLATLNTNVRYLHEGLSSYAEQLTSTFPEPLSVSPLQSPSPFDKCMHTVPSWTAPLTEAFTMRYIRVCAPDREMGHSSCAVCMKGLCRRCRLPTL